MQKKADSIVASYWGKTNFHKYIQLDSSISQYLVYGPHLWEKECPFNSKLTFKPNTCRYRYWVIHPAFGGDTARIEFYLDKEGKFFMGGADGLISCGDLNTVKILTKEQAIQKVTAYLKDGAGGTGFRNGVKGGGVHGEWTVTLKWHHSVKYNGNYVFDELIKGHFTWDVKADLDAPYSEGCSSFNKRTYGIDIFSGKLVYMSESAD